MSNQAPIADDQRSRLAAEMFPREWAAALRTYGAALGLAGMEDMRERAAAYHDRLAAVDCMPGAHANAASFIRSIPLSAQPKETPNADPA